ncbi:alpha/beta hydrolase family protein [Streptomyces sp. NPDC001118]
MWSLEAALQIDTDMHAFFRKIFGAPRTQRERYEANSPHFEGERMTTPMLIVHGRTGHRDPMGQALSLHGDLQRLGVPVRCPHFAAPWSRSPLARAAVRCAADIVGPVAYDQPGKFHATPQTAPPPQTHSQSGGYRRCVGRRGKCRNDTGDSC